MTTLVYRYGLRAPTDNAELVGEQMRAAHRYRNTLVEIERGRRAAQRDLLLRHGDVAAMEEAARAAVEVVVSATRMIKAHKAAGRTSKVPDDLRAALQEARAARATATAALFEARRSTREDPDVAIERAAIDERAADLRRSTRAHCGAFWGTYLIIEDEDQAMRKMPLFKGREPNDPRFKFWRHEGAVSAQIQGGMFEDELLDDTRLRICPNPAADVKKTGRRAGHQRMLHLRVGSDERRGPIWASWPMTMHRPLPPGCQIKRATVHRRRIGPRDEWYVTLTLELLADTAPRACRAGAVALDVGWRVLPDGRIRVARWLGQDGASGEVTLDDAQQEKPLADSLRKPEQLRAIRDRNFNEARGVFAAWLASQSSQSSQSSPPPAWLLEATTTMLQWRSPARLAAVAVRWRAARWNGDEAGFAVLEAWRVQDKHLWLWETSQRTSSLRRRRIHYQRIAAKLAARYDCIVLEKFDKRAIAKRPDVLDTNASPNETARSNRQLVATSELESAFKNAFRGAVVEVSAVDTTRTCNVCGVVEAFDAAANISNTCGTCHATWDQDDNAAANILQRHLNPTPSSGGGGRERPGDGGSPGGARSEQPAEKESRWKKARRMRADKDARKEATRMATCSDGE